MFRKLFVTFEYFKKYPILILFIIVLSAFFSFAGGAASFSDDELWGYGALWVVWGAVWGYICGCLGCDVLYTKVLKKGQPWRNLLKGIPFCIFVSVVIGGVNGYLSRTEDFGMLLGVFFGLIAGLLLVLIFNIINRRH